MSRQARVAPRVTPADAKPDGPLPVPVDTSEATVPVPGESAEITERTSAVARNRLAARHPAVSVEVKSENGTASLKLYGHDHHARLIDAFGTTSGAFADRQLLLLIQRASTKNGVDQVRLNAMLAIVDGSRPENEMEAALAVQIALTHDLAAHMMSRAACAQSIELLNATVNATTKLQRTMVAQMEALAKIRRGGEQHVNVKHVHVHEGGQAVVGVVNHSGAGRAQDGNGRQSNACTVSGAEMRGEDAVGQILPIPSRKG